MTEQEKDKILSTVSINKEIDKAKTELSETIEAKHIINSASFARIENDIFEANEKTSKRITDSRNKIIQKFSDVSLNNFYDHLRISEEISFIRTFLYFILGFNVVTLGLVGFLLYSLT